MPDLPPPPPDAEPLDFEPPPEAQNRDESSTAAMMPTPSRSGVFRFSKINLEEPIVAKGYSSVVVFDGLVLKISHSGVRAKLNRLKSQSIATDDITEVIWKEPSALINGYLRVVTVSVFGDRSDEGDPMSDPLAVQVTKQQVGGFVELRSALDFARAHGLTS